MGIAVILFLAGFAGLLVLAFVRHPAFGLLAYLLAFYCHPPTLWPGALPDIRWSLAAAIVALVATLLHGSSRPALGTPSARIVAAYAAWMWLQLAWAVNLERALEGAILFTKYVVLLVIVVRVIDSRERVAQLAWVHVLGCCVLAAIAWTEGARFLSPDGRLEKLGGPGIDDANSLAAHSITALAFAGGLLSGGPVAPRVLALVAGGLILRMIVLCQSRGALLAMGAAALAGLALAPLGRRRAIVAVAVLAAGAMVALGGDAYWERMRTIEDYDREASAASRIELVGPSLRVFLDHPLGAGHEGFRILSPRYCPPHILGQNGERSPHATVLAVLAEQGIVGLGLLAALGIAAAREVRRLRDDALALPGEAGRPYLAATVAIGASLAAYAVAGLTGNHLKAEVQIWMVGLAGALRHTLDAEAAAARAPRLAATAAAGPRHGSRRRPLLVRNPIATGGPRG